MTVDFNSNFSDMQSANWFLTIPGLHDLCVKIKYFKIPGVTTGSTRVPNRSDYIYSEGGDHIYFEDLTIKMFLDEDMRNYRRFLRWMRKNVHSNQAMMTSVFVHILDNNRELQGVEIEFVDAYPIGLSDIDMDTDAYETNLSFSVTFRYQSMQFTDEEDDGETYYD